MKVQYSQISKKLLFPTRGVESRKIIQFSSLENPSTNSLKHKPEDFIFTKIKSNSKDDSEKYIIPNLISLSCANGKVAVYDLRGTRDYGYIKICFGFAVASRSKDNSNEYEFKFYSIGEVYTGSSANAISNLETGESIELKDKMETFIKYFTLTGVSNNVNSNWFNPYYTLTEGYNNWIFKEQIKVLFNRIFDLFDLEEPFCGGEETFNLVKNVLAEIKTEEGMVAA